MRKACRNTFDKNIIPILKEKSHLSIIINPLHGTGIRSLIEHITLARIMTGTSGAIIEVHQQPGKVMFDD